MESDADDLALVVDPARRTGRTLLAAGVAQSYVDVVDPRHLHFEYVRRMAAVIDLAAPPGRPLTALHLGAVRSPCRAGWPPPAPDRRSWSSSGTRRSSTWSAGNCRRRPLRWPWWSPTPGTR